MMKKTILLLIGGLTFSVPTNSYAQNTDEIINDQNPELWVGELIPTEETLDLPTTVFGAQEQTTTLKQYFAQGCALYGLHDGGLNESQFFCFRQTENGQIGGRWFFGVFEGADFEGLDYNGDYLVISSGDDTIESELMYDGRLWRSSTPELEQCDFNSISSPRPGVAQVAGTPMAEVDGIAFDSVGNLWGWAQEAGLFMIPKTDAGYSLAEAEMKLPQPGEVEDIEILNGKLYGVLNLDHLGQAEDGNGEPHTNHPTYPTDTNAAVQENGSIQVNFVEYDPNSGELNIPCEEQIINQLQQVEFSAAEIEALEVLPKIPGVDEDRLLLGFHTTPLSGRNQNQNTLVLGVLGLAQCRLELHTLNSFPGRDHKNRKFDVEGLAMVCPPVRDVQPD